MLQRGIELRVTLMDRQSFGEGPRKASHQAMIRGQAKVRLALIVSARQCEDSQDVGVSHEIGVEVVDLGQGQLQDDVVIWGELTQLFRDALFQDLLRLTLLGAPDVDLGFDDGNQSSGDDLVR